MFVTPSLVSVVVSFSLATLVRSNCECGYTVNGTLYTDLIESDFLHLNNITNNTDWLPQKYSTSAAVARGPFGKSVDVNNIQPNPLKSPYDWAGNGVNGGAAGLQLIVRGGMPVQGGMVPVAEMVTNRSDLLYGSFRAGMRMTATNGTCGAFFWYFNDTQEVDMEFLSKQQNSSSHPVNLVLQSPQSDANGFNAANTGTFDVNNLQFDPTDSFHEYRFDWAPASVSFYADNVLLKTMTKDVPTSPGHITLSHWSNGDPNWSAGPPETDAILTVEYLKGYFNSSETARQNDWTKRCPNVAAPNATCEVPELVSAPNGNGSAATYFFSHQKNMTVNQTVSGMKSSGFSMNGDAQWRLQGILTVLTLIAMVNVMEGCL